MSKSNRPGIRRVDNNKFRIRVTAIDPETGRRKEIDRVVTAANINEAVKAQVALRDELRTAVVEPNRVTLEAYARRWLEKKEA
jgi:hypothetical protein